MSDPFSDFNLVVRECEICGKYDGKLDEEFDGYVCDECSSKWIPQSGGVEGHVGSTNGSLEGAITQGSAHRSTLR